LPPEPQKIPPIRRSRVKGTSCCWFLVVKNLSAGAESNTKDPGVAHGK
jgi:hypothetical protein